MSSDPALAKRPTAPAWKPPTRPAPKTPVTPGSTSTAMAFIVRAGTTPVESAAMTRVIPARLWPGSTADSQRLHAGTAKSE
ncbi:hypothetical protein [Nocardia sp. NBC_01327]|uniref:hypothetical protein n=1 Tax=Nocardia sp. NBC_01327 TaxID=2903593 RepID=UPI002E0FF059|nr:hypothetical protein OG326_32690 [Nocardia sp. NBC_01327]